MIPSETPNLAASSEDADGGHNGDPMSPKELTEQEFASPPDEVSSNVLHVELVERVEEEQGHSAEQDEQEGGAASAERVDVEGARPDKTMVCTKGPAAHSQNGVCLRLGYSFWTSQRLGHACKGSLAQTKGQDDVDVKPPWGFV